MFHHYNENNHHSLIPSTVMLSILFAGAIMLSPSIAVHAEEEQNIAVTQAVDTTGEDTIESASVSEYEKEDTPAAEVNTPSVSTDVGASDVSTEVENNSESKSNDVVAADTVNVQAAVLDAKEEASNAGKATHEDALVTDGGTEDAGEAESDNTQKDDAVITEATDSALTDSTEISENTQKENASEPEAGETYDAARTDSDNQVSNKTNDKSSVEKTSDGKGSADQESVETISEDNTLSTENASDTEEGEIADTPNQPPVQDGENNSESTANYVTPQDFGAKGDNESDDTEAINQAIGSLSTEHDTLYIPDGSYRVNTIQKINLRSDIKVILGNNAKLIAIPNGEKSYCILSLRGLNNVSITGGQLFGDRYEHQGSEGEWGHGIGVFDSSNIIFDGIKIFNCWGDGIYLGSDHEWTQDAGCSNIIIQNCELAGNRRNDLSIVSADYVTLKNCIFRDANGTDPQFGVDIETNYESNPNQHIYLDNCTFYGNAKGSVLINSAANDVQISNSVLNGNFINYAGTDVVLSNTTVNGDAYCRKGIVLKDNSVINGRGNTNDVAVVDYSAANAAPLHSYRQDSSNRISSWFASDTNSPSGSYIGIVRTGWGTHDAGITLRLTELSGGRFGKMIPGRTYRIQYTVMGTGAWGYISNQTGWYPILPQGEAYSTGIVTYLAGDTADGTLSFYATGLNDGMWLRIANIQVLDEDYSGMSQQNDGTWVYSENGNVDTQYTGMASNENGWWYFNNGAIDWNYTGMAANENGWWYYRNGKIDWNYTGEGTCQYGTWYYRNGRIPYDLTSVVWTGSDWRYVRGGQIITDYTGMAANENGWWYFNNGAIDWNYTGMAANENGWWYYRNGKIDWNYTGEGTCQYGTWYYRNGRIPYDLTSVVWTGSDWRYVRGGQIITDYTGMAANENGWWYFNNGAIDWNYTGMAANENGWWYYRNGKIDWNYTGEGTCQYGTWYYRNGRIPYDLTSVVWTGSDWRYVRGGQIITDYTGMAANENGWWYFNNGAIDWNYTGMAANENGWWYYRNGKIDWNYTGEGICQSGTWYYQNGRISYNLTGVVWTGKQWRYIVKGKVMTDFTGTVLDGEDKPWSFINGQTA